MAKDAPAVFVVADDPKVPRTIRALAEEMDLAVESFETGRAFLDRVPTDRPGGLVVGLPLRRMGGLAFQHTLCGKGFTLPMIFLAKNAKVSTTVRAMRAGAFNFVQRPFRKQVLLEKIQEALTRDRADRAARSRREAIVKRIRRLTRRQREVLDLLVDGLSNKQIASRLRISQKTGEFHRALVMWTLQVGSLAAVVRLVQQVRPDYSKNGVCDRTNILSRTYKEEWNAIGLPRR